MGYFIIPDEVFFHERLSANEKLFYALIKRLTYNRGYCYMSNKKLAEHFGVEIKTIKRWLRELKGLDLISITGGTRKRHIHVLGGDDSSNNEQNRGQWSSALGDMSGPELGDISGDKKTIKKEENTRENTAFEAVNDLFEYFCQETDQNDGYALTDGRRKMLEECSTSAALGLICS